VRFATMGDEGLAAHAACGVSDPSGRCPIGTVRISPAGRKQANSPPSSPKPSGARTVKAFA
jgi:hypothetical protein